MAVFLSLALNKRRNQAGDWISLLLLFSSPADAEENGRPFLDYVLTAIADAGYKKVCLVIGPGHLALQQYYTDVEKKKLEISFATQDEPKGLEREREREREREKRF